MTHAPSLASDPVIASHYAIACGIVRAGSDLSARQLAVLMTVVLTDGPHTVRGMAAALGVSKPAITRALDRLGELDLAQRKVDPEDRRSVLVTPLAKGISYVEQMAAFARKPRAAAA